MATASKKSSEIKPENLVTIERDIPNPYDGRLIYCIVANTVSTPLEFGTVGEMRMPKRVEGTRLIQQVPGRMAAQAAHAVSKVRHMMLRREVLRADRVARKMKSKEHWYKSEMLFFFPVTTIILSCRDSNELFHVKHLLHKTSVEYQVFWDTNPEVYGPDKVLTAVATHPVEPEQVKGILDYLPLWTPKNELYSKA